MLAIENHITACLRAVEKKFKKGDSIHWSTHDFEQLANAIHIKTGVLLSVSTLKRLWGKVKHSNKPNRSTLDALAKYLEHEDWTIYVNTRNVVENEPIAAPRATIPIAKKLLLAAAAVGVVLLLTFYYFKSSAATEKPVLPANILFESNVVSDEIPNSVVFKFSPLAVGEDTKVEIQQDWDLRKRTPIDGTDSIATSIYYRPGYFKAKLVVGDSIVGEDDVYIPTKGWMGLIEQNPKPIYLKTEEFYNNNILAIDTLALAGYGLDPAHKETWVSFYNIREFGELYTDDFTMETSIRNTWKEGASPCQNIRLGILYDGGAVVIPLSRKGCISDLGLMSFNDVMLSGKNHDLSGFGTNTEGFQTVKCESKNNTLVFYVNDILALSIPTEKISKKIMGIVYHFEGTGTVKNLTLSNSNEVFFKYE
ncbi:hypothetical protein [uncultured Croceitalea sp.]|uniref:hypothetical protein n=1 Tax=uncultured Croceitalea sp. TaxID=1798908 RepID=UPI003305A9B4